MIAALLTARDARRCGRGGACARSRADVGLSTSCRCSTRRSSGSRAGPTSSIRRRRRCTATSPKPGGVSRRRNEADVILEDALGDTDTQRCERSARRDATLDDLFRRAARARPDALALIDPPDRRALHRRAGAPPHLCAGRPRDLGARRAAARLRPADRFRRGDPASQYGRERDRAARRDARRADRGAAAAVVAPCRCGGGAEPGRGARADRLPAHRRYRCMAISRCISRWRPSRSASCAGSARTCPTAWCRSTTSSRAAASRPRSSATAMPRDHVALVTFDIAAEGIVPVARSHAELIAGGLAVHLEARIEPDAVMLGALALASFAGLATTVVPWLLARRHARAASAVRAGRVRAPVRARNDAPSRCCPARWRCGSPMPGCSRDGLHAVLAVWRAPERLAASAAWSGATHAGRRSGVRRDRPGRRRAAAPTASRRRLPSGRLVLPRGAPQGMHVLDRRAHGRRHARALRPDGAARAFPPGAERGEHAAPEDRRRQHRHRLCLPHRSRRPSC